MKDVTERFLTYVSYETTSNEDSPSQPSSEKELLLGAALANELLEIGLTDAALDETGNVYAHIPASVGYENAPCVGFIAHMDTAPDASGANVRPRRLLYEGGPIALSDTVSVTEADSPFLPSLVGQELIVTDGTTLLGADDKAGVAEIVAMAETLVSTPSIPHGRIAIAFTPDEEIGRGTDCFDKARFGADFAYTADGGAVGELEYENFNAASAKFIFHGTAAHTGDAKNRLVNAVRLGAELISLLPANETPEHTEGYEGFYHIQSFTGDMTTAEIRMLIRDFDPDGFEKRKDFLRRCIGFINAAHGEGRAEVVITDSYFNMLPALKDSMFVIDRAKEALKANGITPVTVAIRGGTDGARLSCEGLPCPNLGTGGYNYHSVRELVSVDQMKKNVAVLVSLASEV